MRRDGMWKPNLLLPLLLFFASTRVAATSYVEQERGSSNDLAAVATILGATIAPGGIPSVTIPGQRPFSGVALPLGIGIIGSNGGGVGGGGGHKAAPPSQNNSNKEKEREKPCVSTSNPVVIATGEKHKAEQDFQAAGLYGLSLTRTYRSQHNGMLIQATSPGEDVRLYHYENADQTLLTGITVGGTSAAPFFSRQRNSKTIARISNRNRLAAWPMP